MADRPSARARVRTGDTAAASDATPACAPLDDAQRSQTQIESDAPIDAALERVLLGDEQTRAHGFSAAIGLIAAGVLAGLPFLDGNPDAKRAFGVAIAVTVASSAWVWRATSARHSYSRGLLRAYAWTIAITVVFVEYYVGIFSAVAAVMTLGIYYVGQSADPVQSLVIPVVVIGTYSALAVLLTLGIVPDRGLFDATQAPLSTHVFGTSAGVGVLLFTAYLGRMSRASMRATIERSNEAALMAQKREALLAEAQQHLECALGVAIGKAGHYTGKLAGPYRLDVIIGIGAMGEIYAARHIETAQSAAVKLLQVKIQQRADLVERFLREGEICRRLQSPHLAQVYGVGRLDSGAPYMAMELLEGSDLAALLRKEGSLSIDVVVDLAKALAEGLAHAHDAGVVHRDLKPVNVFQGHDAAGRPQWKILDFGISKLRDGSGTLTDVSIVGTPGYMSPEQARGQSVDHRSDIFSMAVVLYRALTGQPAFSGGDTPQIMFEVVYRNPERPSSITKGLATDVDLVLALALAKDRDERWQSAREFAQAFQLAARQSLGPELKARAHAIVRAYPWNQIAPLGGRSLVSFPAGRLGERMH